MAKQKQITSKKSKLHQTDARVSGQRNIAPTAPSSRSSVTRSAPRTLHIELLSDTTFSRGEGTAGVVDAEVEHDEFGIPYIGGKSIRGLLRDGWLSMQVHFPELHHAAGRVLGHGQALDDTCRMRISDAVLPSTIRDVARNAVERREHTIAPSTMLEAFTAVRYQTAENRATGAPEETTLRSSRVVLHGFVFESRLTWLNRYEPDADDLRVLALCALAVRNGGLLRNRGRGFLQMTLDGDPAQTRRYLEATA
jgi:hypothetical protein